MWQSGSELLRIGQPWQAAMSCWMSGLGVIGAHMAFL